METLSNVGVGKVAKNRPPLKIDNDFKKAASKAAKAYEEESEELTRFEQENFTRFSK